MVLGDQNIDEFTYQEDTQYGLPTGNYILSNIYSDYPIALLINSDQKKFISFNGECHKKK